MKIKAMLYHKEKKRLMKPTKREATYIVKALEPSIESLDVILDKLLDGHTIRPGITIDGVKDDDWVAQQLILIDVDNKHNVISMKEQLDLCKTLNIMPTMIYKSFNYTDKNQKHRLVFLLKDEVNDIEVRNKYVSALNNIFRGDKATINPCRIFYGTNKGYYYKDINNIVDNKKLEELINKDLNCNAYKKADKQNALKASNNADSSDFLNTGKINNKYIYYKLILPHFQIERLKLVYNRLEKYFSSDNFVRKHKNKTFLSHADFNSYVRAIPLNEILDVNLDNQGFCNCLLHDDKTPSAKIGNHNGTSYYKCFGECISDRTYDIFSLTSLVLFQEFGRYKAAKDYLIKKFNAIIAPSPWYIHQSLIIKSYRKFLLEIKNYKDDYKHVYNKLRYEKTLATFRGILDIAEKSLDFIEAYEGEDLVFCASFSYIRYITKIQSNSIVQNKIDDLAAMGFLEQLSDKEARNTCPKQYKASKELLMGLTEIYPNKHLNTINMYKLKYFDLDAVEKANERLRRFKEKGLTRKTASGNSFEAIGIDARKKKLELNRENNKDYNTLRLWFKKEFNRKGLVLYKSYIEYARKKFIKTARAETFIPLFLDEFKMKKVRGSKEIAKDLNLKSNISRQICFIKNKK